MKRLVRHPAVQALLARLLGTYLSFALATTRWRLEGEENLARLVDGEPHIVAFWHERLPLMPMLWLMVRRLPRSRPRPVHVLVSRHRDGRFIGTVIGRFDMQVVIGSSSRGGAAGLRALLGLLRDGGLVAITPDGPRGPRRHAAPGVAQLAALSGAPGPAMRGADLAPVGAAQLGPHDDPSPVRARRGGLPPGNRRRAGRLARGGDGDRRGPLRRGGRGGPALSGMTGSAIWSAATTLAAPALRLMLRRRARRGKEIPARLAERRGIETGARPQGRLLWLHAASVGESLSILPVLQGLDRLCPELALLLTTGTVTSAVLMRERLDTAGLERVLHRFAPLDVPSWAARFLDHWRPDVAAFVESELWPNLLAACRARHIPTMLVNARLSRRSYRHWRHVPFLARRVLGSFDLVHAQSTDDADQLSALGARRVLAPGNLKFAAPPLPADPILLDDVRAMLAGRPCWVAASTHPGEDEIVLAAHRRLAPTRPGLISIIVPRHPARGAAVAAASSGLRVTRRALGEPPPSEGVWVADTLGELGLWYRLAAAALVGRSLLPPGGGQNPLEPARLGCPVAAGPYMDNFADPVRVLEAAGALARVQGAADLAGWIGTMLDDKPRREAAGSAGARAAAGYAHLPDSTAAALLDLLARRHG